LDRVCCLELKTAVLIIGVFNLVAALFGVLGYKRKQGWRSGGWTEFAVWS